MEILKALLIGAGVYAVLQGTDSAPSNLEMALLAALWGAGVGLVFWRIERRRTRRPPRSLDPAVPGQTGKEKPDRGRSAAGQG